ncbi:MAG: hypothetical protein SGPRY_002444 [Prymnesium sp.]
MARSASLLVASLLGALLARQHYISRPAYPSDPLPSVAARLTRLSALAAHKRQRIVLVTGAAGFVGFHTALQLHSEGDGVIGLDNFNSYYDVSLKRARSALLARAGMNALIEGDVCDAELLTTILREGRVSHVIHLAAQAGVRYSLKKPLAYVEANVRCFVTLLEAVNAVNSSVPIAYASSSSVYGMNSVIPFSETHQAAYAHASLHHTSEALRMSRWLLKLCFANRWIDRPLSTERPRSRMRTSHTVRPPPLPSCMSARRPIVNHGQIIIYHKDCHRQYCGYMIGGRMLFNHFRRILKDDRMAIDDD